jgi:hypothetical protein
MLYAQINRKTNLIVNNPGRLPDRWTTPEGATITHFNKLPKKSLQAFNWLPVIYEELSDGATHSLTPFYDEANQQFVYEAIPQDISILVRQSERRIDEAASFASARYISQGIGQEYRYMIKREQAISFLRDPEQPLSDCHMIKREAEETGRTPKEIAQLIVDTACLWIDLAAEIEALRCGGKKKCREAIDVTDVIQYRNAAISALELI